MELKDYKKLCKVKGYDIREHQQYFITSNEFDNSRKPFVLAGGTSMGKTPTFIMWLELFYQNPANKNKQTIVFAASKTILRNNVHETLKGFKPSFSYSIITDKERLVNALDRKAQVLIVIPQTITKHYKLLPKMHNFILDEAHEWYFAKSRGGKQSTLDKIIKHIQPTKQLFLTGTPSKFVANGDKFKFQFVPVMDLYDAGLVSNVKLEVVSSTYDFKANDWLGSYGNLKSTKTNSPKQAEDALIMVCNEMIDKLKNPLKEWYNINNITKHSIGKLFKYLDKTIIYTHSKKQADRFYSILNGKKELSGKVLLSHSENDPDSVEFNKFKTDEKYHILIAVDRGRIGFDMPELFNIVDFTMTQNLDMLLQMYGRLLRISNLQKKKQKIYFKVATKNTADYFVDLMTAMLCLTNIEWYSKYNGKNMGGILIPKVLTKSIRNKQYQQSGKKTKSNKVKPYVSLTELGIPMDLNFFRQSILHSSNSKFNTIAETTLDDVRRECFGLKTIWTEDKIREEALKYKTKSEFITNGSNIYQAARKAGIIDEVMSHMECKLTYWTEDKIREEALKYKTKSEFSKNHSHAVKMARQLGIMDDVCSHMHTLRKYWTENEIREEALKYKTKSEFQKNNNGAYKKAKLLGIHDDVCSHMEQKNFSFTEKEVIKEAKKYKIRSHFKNNTKYSNAAYRWAKNNNLLNKLFPKK